jgi:hypothetical protein
MPPQLLDNCHQVKNNLFDQILKCKNYLPTRVEQARPSARSRPKNRISNIKMGRVLPNAYWDFATNVGIVNV